MQYNRHLTIAEKTSPNASSLQKSLADVSVAVHVILHLRKFPHYEEQHFAAAELNILLLLHRPKAADAENGNVNMTTDQIKDVAEENGHSNNRGMSDIDQAVAPGTSAPNSCIVQ